MKSGQFLFLWYSFDLFIYCINTHIGQVILFKAIENKAFLPLECMRVYKKVSSGEVEEGIAGNTCHILPFFQSLWTGLKNWHCLMSNPICNFLYIIKYGFNKEFFFYYSLMLVWFDFSQNDYQSTIDSLINYTKYFKITCT